MKLHHLWVVSWSTRGPQGSSSGLKVRQVVGVPKGRGHVLRLAQDGKTTERVDVTLGSPQGDWVHVAQGLARTDRVVMAGAAHLVPGDTIRPVAPHGSQP